MTKEDAARDIINRFQEHYGVSREMLEAYIGRKAEAFTVESINRLRGVYTAIKDGTASVEQYFEMTPSAAPAQDKPPEAPKSLDSAAKSENQVSLRDV